MVGLLVIKTQQICRGICSKYIENIYCNSAKNTLLTKFPVRLTPISYFIFQLPTTQIVYENVDNCRKDRINNRMANLCICFLHSRDWISS